MTEDCEDRHQLSVTIITDVICSTTKGDDGECVSNHRLTLWVEVCNGVALCIQFQTWTWYVWCSNLSTINFTTRTTKEGDQRGVLNVWRCLNNWKIKVVGKQWERIQSVILLSDNRIWSSYSSTICSSTGKNVI